MLVVRHILKCDVEGAKGNGSAQNLLGIAADENASARGRLLDEPVVIEMRVRDDDAQKVVIISLQAVICGSFTSAGSGAVRGIPMSSSSVFPPEDSSMQLPPTSFVPRCIRTSIQV
jgi:hypothetical protein